jgi:acyl-CoA dehydrogenase
METQIALDPVGHLPSTQSLQSRLKAATAVAARCAGEVDEGSRFPVEAIETLKAQRLLGIQVPVALGGEGLTIADVADACYALGQACASTGMIYAMHQIKIACLMRHRRDSAVLDQLLRTVSAKQLLFASSTTEGKGGGNVRASEAAIQQTDDRIALERVASVISYGAYADGIVTTARRTADSPASDQVLVAFLKADYTLTRMQSWSTLGMRGTCSEGYTLKATGIAGQIVPDPYEIIHTQTMVPFAHLLWGSVWAGIAAGAVTRAQSFLRQAMRQSNGQPPPGAAQFTKAVSSLRTLRGLLSSARRSYESAMADAKQLESLEFQSMIALTKVEASELAVSIVQLALRTCGLSGYRRDSEFSIERHLRDILSAPIMINNERILSNLATTVLMTPLSQTLRD